MNKMNNLWLSDSVAKFWQGVNWENQVLVDGINALERRMTVRQYFQSIPWSMMPVAVDNPPETTVNGKAEASDTLADFLQDVSKFF